MIFSSVTFLYYFFPLFLCVYFGARDDRKNTVAIIGSLIFYTWGEPLFALVLTGMSVVIYTLGNFLSPEEGAAGFRRKAILWVGLLITIGMLGWFKYANFCVAQANALRAYLGMAPVPWTHIVLPIGISFFTFQKISYLLDVYRGTTKPARSLSDFLLFVALFPQLIAGPIIRYHEISDQIRTRTHSLENFHAGLWRFLLGLGRKVLIANPLGLTADKIFAMEPTTLPVQYAWIGMLAFAFQIYFDFAGYSDMAIGMARMMGFTFMENFDRPYTSRSITEFWQRWHISLGAFMREYLYIPLGGNRGSVIRTSINLWIVFLVSGLWHGASWTFVAWGAFHGALLSIERVIGRKRIARLPTALGVAVTFTLVSLGWVLFKSNTISHAIGFYHRLWAWESWPNVYLNLETLPQEIIPNRTWGTMALAAVFSFLPNLILSKTQWGEPVARTFTQKYGRLAVATVCFILATASFVSDSYNPFIYYRF